MSRPTKWTPAGSYHSGALAVLFLVASAWFFPMAQPTARPQPTPQAFGQAAHLLTYKGIGLWGLGREELVLAVGG